MRPLQSVVIFALLASAPALNAEAAGAVGVPLAQVAHDANLTYTWLVGTRAVQLNGPGIVLVVRPGDNLYEVNDRVEISADAPHYVSNDIYVSRALANHITHLARQAQLLDEAPSAQLVGAALTARNGTTGPRGTIVLNVEPLKGAEALIVSGQAPPSAPVMITLLATLSSELPNIVLSRHNLETGPDGRFQAIVPIAPDYVRDSFIRVLATSSPGVISASAQLLVHPPNEGVKVPVDSFPGGIW
jgi:hypothetical protein